MKWEELWMMLEKIEFMNNPFTLFFKIYLLYFAGILLLTFLSFMLYFLGRFLITPIKNIFKKPVHNL